MGYDWTGRDAGTCPGYLDVYISGQNVAHINTGGHGGSITWSCALGVVSGVAALIVSDGAAAIGWAALDLGITGLGCAGG